MWLKTQTAVPWPLDLASPYWWCLRVPSVVDVDQHFAHCRVLYGDVGVVGPVEWKVMEG